MIYRNMPRRPRKYVHTGLDSIPVSSPEGANTINEVIKRIEDIPMPNEIETAPTTQDSRQSDKLPSFFNILKSRIHIEEILLVGLILVLLDEGVEDDFLSIMLLYILLAGKS